MMNAIYERAKRLVSEHVLCLFNAAWERGLSQTQEGQDALEEAILDACDLNSAIALEGLKSEFGDLEELTQEELDEIKTRPTLDGCGSWSDYIEDDLFDVERLEEDLKEHFLESLEPMQFYLVTEWLGERLLEQGELVVRTHDLYIWSRCAYGQALEYDACFQAIATDLINN